MVALLQRKFFNISFLRILLLIMLDDVGPINWQKPLKSFFNALFVGKF